MWSIVSLSPIWYFTKVITQITGQQRRKCSKEVSSGRSGSKFGSVVNGIVEASLLTGLLIPLLFWGQMCIRGTWWWKVTHISEESGSDEQEDCARKVMVKTSHSRLFIVNRYFTTLNHQKGFYLMSTKQAITVQTNLDNKIKLQFLIHLLFLSIYSYKFLIFWWLFKGSYRNPHYYY